MSYKENIMYECFLEIAFEAELNTKEDPELMLIAPEQCNENVATRETAVMALRRMIVERGEVKPYRTDDEHLLKFLRSKDFVVRRAYRHLVRYYTFREQYPHLYQDVDLWDLVKVKDVVGGTMLDRPDTGRITIFRLGLWDPSEIPVEDVLRACYAIVEIGIRQPKLQIIGGLALIDLQGLTMRHVAVLTPNIAYQIVCLLGTAMPTKMRSIHIINYSWILHTFFYIFKRFIPQNFLNKIYFHGYDLKSLHQQIDPECLPARYGGTCRSLASIDLWLRKIKKYRDVQFDRDMKELGYVVKE